MKKFITYLIVIAACGGICQAEPLQLVFCTADGSEHPFAATSLKMSVTGGNLVVTNSETTAEFGLTTLTQMYFTGEETGVKCPAVSVALTESVQVYTVDGKSAGSYASVAEASANLESGVYVFKTESGSTFKLRVE